MLFAMPNALPPELQQQLYPQLIQFMPEAVVVFDSAMKVQCWNRQAESIFGISRAEAIGKDVFSMLNRDAEQTGNSPFATSQVCRRHGDQKSIFVRSATASIEMNDSRWTAAFFLDVTSEQNEVRQLTRAASTDPLSGLLNRRGFQEQLEQNLDGKLTLAIVDADNFKKINDTYGHAAGDQGVQFIAGTLRESFPNAVCLARLGGDEFGIVTRTMPEDQTDAAYQKFLRRVSTGIAGSITPDTNLALTVSVGIAVSNVAGTSARELLTTADRALYAAKEAGRNQAIKRVINV